MNRLDSVSRTYFFRFVMLNWTALVRGANVERNQMETRET